ILSKLLLTGYGFGPEVHRPLDEASCGLSMTTVLKNWKLITVNSQLKTQDSRLKTQDSRLKTNVFI
ncbi:MAG TPA: hypothetical protein PKL83_01360, partial [bacterium]|nr:hypothetical protein [bacterium]